MGCLPTSKFFSVVNRPSSVGMVPLSAAFISLSLMSVEGHRFGLEAAVEALAAAWISVLR